MYFMLVILLFTVSCDQSEDNNDNVSCDDSTVIVSLQDSDNVSIVRASNLEIEDQISINLD